MLFSAKTGGFYSASFHKQIPDDARDISDALYAQLLAGQEAGGRIVAGADGKPTLVKQAGPTPAEQLSAERQTMVASRFQARMALRNAGLFEGAEAAVAASADPLLMEAWDSAVEYRRLSPSILTLGAALELDDAAIDQLFRDAAEITA